MHGVVTLLPQPYDAQVEHLWDELEQKFGLRGIRITPYPHFSWQLGEEYQLPALKTTLEEIAASQPPFTVTTSGLGFFTGEKPVMYIPVVKSPQLMTLHALIWEKLQPLTTDASPYYSPAHWMPHISLAYEDLTLAKMGNVAKTLAFRSFNWQFEVNNLSFIFEPSGTTGTLQVTIPFIG